MSKNNSKINNITNLYSNNLKDLDIYLDKLSDSDKFKLIGEYTKLKYDKQLLNIILDKTNKDVFLSYNSTIVENLIDQNDIATLEHFVEKVKNKQFNELIIEFSIKKKNDSIFNYFVGKIKYNNLDYLTSISIVKNNKIFFDTLLKNNIKFKTNVLHAASESKNIYYLNYLLENNKINKNADFKSAFVNCAYCNNFKAIDLLIDYVDQNTIDYSLVVATDRLNLKIVEKLIPLADCTTNENFCLYILVKENCKESLIKKIIPLSNVDQVLTSFKNEKNEACFNYLNNLYNQMQKEKFEKALENEIQNAPTKNKRKI